MKDKAIERMMAELELLVQNQKEPLVQRIGEDWLNKACLAARFKTLFNKVGIDDVGIICDSFLGLPEGTNSCVDDIIQCRVYFESAMEYAATATNDIPFDGTGFVFYDHFLRVAVDRTWELVCQPIRDRRQNPNPRLSREAAMILLQFDRNKMRLPHNFTYKTFQQLYKYLKNLLAFLLKTSDNRSIWPSVAKIMEFVQQSHEYAALSTCAKWRSWPGVGKIQDVVEQCPNGALVSKLKRGSETIGMLKEEEQDRILLNDNIVRGGSDGGKRTLQIEDAWSYEDLVDLLSSYHVNLVSGLMMDMDDWMTFVNSPIVVDSIFKKLMSVFHPENGVPIPLDVLAGVSSRGECVTEDGPNIKVYLQKHPRENKCVTVVTLEKYLSRGYSDECYDGINDMYFQDLDNGSYLRVATTEVFPGYPSPYITFGNTQSSLRFYQATSSMVKLERDVLEMTKYIYQLVDNVLKDSLECMKIVLLRKSHPGKKINCAKRRWSDLVDHGISDDRFLFPLGEHVPKDIPDSIVAQASKNKPYGHHSDTGPIKNCNHDDKQKWSHAKMMRIVSYGFAYEADDVNDHRTLNDDAVVSIKHGIPCLGENDFCTLIGYFCSSEKKFVRWTTIMGSAISIGSENHVHIQLPGSQGEMHHFIDSKKEKKDGVCRVVLSTRQLKPFQKTVDVQKSRVIGDSVRLHPANSHKTKNVVRLLMGKVHFPSASDDLENIKLGKKKLSGRQRTKMMNNNGQLKVELGAHRNGHLIEGEHKHRQFVIGMPNSISTESIGRCVNSGKALYQEGCTALFDRKDSSKVIVGPYVCKHEGESGYKLLRPGSKVDDLNALSGITANNRYHQVMNVDRCDIFNLHRIQKNSAEVGFNLARAIRAQHGSVHPKLKTMIMRGRGGASVLAGSLPIDSSNNKASRENPTHILSSNQNLTDKHAMALFGCCENQQCVNVFYENIYIGPFYIEDVHCKKHTIDEYREELKKLEQVLKELNGLAPGIFPNSIVTDNMKRELIGMTSMNICIRLVPLDDDFLLKWKDNNDVPWKVIDLHDEDIERPTFHVDQDEVMNLTLLGDAVEFTDSFNLLSKTHLSFLTDAAKERFEFIHVNDDDDVNYDEGDIDYIEQPLGTFNTSQFVGAAFHAAAFTMIKAFDESVLDADKCTMNPPRHFIMKNLVRNGQTYKDVLKKLNLKPVAMMPLHPPHLFGDPVILIALASCNSFEACLRLSNDDGEWIHRNGVNYLLNNDEAWAIIFKCIVCCLMNPSALLHISSRCGNLFLVPNPEGNEFDKFVKTVRLFEWEKRFLHPIFSKQFENGDIFIGFLDFLLTSGKHIFQLAVRCNTTKLSQCTRTGVVEYLLRHLNREDGPKLNSFHMQVIMRTIEACIHDPFGVVKVVPSGSGGLSAARCYVEQYDQHNIDDCGKSQKTKCELIPGWLVHWYNNDVQARLSSRNDLAMRQTNDELLVLGLEWSKQLDCLVHKIGIGRKLDPSDMEHCLCMLYTLHQHTLPSRNVGKESRIDGPKYLPIRHTVGECLARDLPFMSHVKEGYDEKMIAYQRLVKDDSYVHHNLPDLFRIDFLV